MKKLFLLLLTAAAATAVACFAGCTNGQTGGGDNTAKQGKMAEEQVQAQDGADDSYGFMPPDMPMSESHMPMPMPPEGRIYSFGGMQHEFMPQMPAGGYSRDGAGDVMPHGRINKNDKKDQMTTEGSTDEKTFEEQTSEEKAEETPQKKPDGRRNKGKRQRTPRQQTIVN